MPYGKPLPLAQVEQILSDVLFWLDPWGSADQHRVESAVTQLQADIQNLPCGDVRDGLQSLSNNLRAQDDCHTLHDPPVRSS